MSQRRQVLPFEPGLRRAAALQAVKVSMLRAPGVVSPLAHLAQRLSKANPQAARVFERIFTDLLDGVAEAPERERS